MHRLSVTCALLCSMGALAQADAGLPVGWFVSGTTRSAYEVASLERGACGTKAIRAAARFPGTNGPIGVLQSFRADDYRGKRLRYSATVDADAVAGWAGLIFRADGVDRKTLSFDDMRNRPVRGTRKCARLSVVADVPPEAQLLTLGVVLQGQGTMELSEIAVEPVSLDEPLTTGLDQSNGRVGDVWFTDAQVSMNDRRLAGRLTLRSPGVWRDATGDLESQVDGERVVARMFSVESGATALPLTGAFTLKHEAGVTIIEGDWGTSLRRYPVLVRLSVAQVDMKWGFYERHLAAEPGPQLPQGCVFFAQRSGATSYADGLEVCGGALSSNPPPVQTVMAFLMSGFRRSATGLPVARPGLAPVPPRQPQQ